MTIELDTLLLLVGVIALIRIIIIQDKESKVLKEDIKEIWDCLENINMQQNLTSQNVHYLIKEEGKG